MGVRKGNVHVGELYWKNGFALIGECRRVTDQDIGILVEGALLL